MMQCACVLVILAIAVTHVGCLRYGFDQQTYAASEQNGAVQVTVIKEDENVDIVILQVRVLTYEELAGTGFTSSLTRPDAAEFEENGRQDFVGTSLMVTFQPSNISASMPITISIVDDRINEVMEGLFLLLSPIQISSVDENLSSRINDGIALVTIEDNDELTLSFLMVAYIISESDTNEVFDDVVSVGKNIVSEVELSVIVNSINGNAISGVDFNFADDVELIFGPEDEILFLSLTILGDEIVEAREDFRLTLSMPPNTVQSLSLGSDTPVLINDDDIAIIGFENTEYTVTEAEGIIFIPVVLISPLDPTLVDPAALFTYDIMTTDGTADGNGVDYDNVLLSAIDFGLGSDNISITIIDDSLDEVVEFFTISGSINSFSVGNVMFQPALANVSIIGDEPPTTMTTAGPTEVTPTTMTTAGPTDVTTTVGMGGDPHFSILLPQNLYLCFSIQGENGFNFNLISNNFLQLNGLFVTDAKKENVTWIGAIGITVKGSKYKKQRDTKIQFVAATETIFLGSLEKLDPTKVKQIKLANGSLALSEREDDYRGPLEVAVDLVDVGLQFTVRFMKGSHLDMVWNKVFRQPENSHGIIGQFLRAGVDVDEARRLLILPNMEPVPVTRKQIWRFMERKVPEKQTCWAAVDPGSQGKRILEGHYLDYLVDDILSSNFILKKHNL